MLFSYDSSYDLLLKLCIYNARKKQCIHREERGFLKYNYTRQEVTSCEENLLDIDIDV